MDKLRSLLEYILMSLMDDRLNITPREYELAVKSILDGAGLGLMNFKSGHLEKVTGVDGAYAIDVTVRFSALGASFLVLVECKHEQRKIERQAVQILHDKLRSTGAQKGMLFSVSGFQDGAIEYADVHGIALVQLAHGSSSWFTRSIGQPTPTPTWANIPEYIGWWWHGNSRSVMSSEVGKYTRAALGIGNQL
jgi:restriction system protein